MKVRVTVVLDIGDPDNWKRTAFQGGRDRRVPDRRSIDDKLEDVLLVVAEGDHPWAVEDAKLEVIEG